MVRLQDDFYDYVNGAWAETAVIQMTNANGTFLSDLIQDIET